MELDLQDYSFIRVNHKMRVFSGMCHMPNSVEASTPTETRGSWLDVAKRRQRKLFHSKMRFSFKWNLMEKKTRDLRSPEIFFTWVSVQNEPTIVLKGAVFAQLHHLFYVLLEGKKSSKNCEDFLFLLRNLFGFSASCFIYHQKKGKKGWLDAKKRTAFELNEIDR